MSIRICLDHEKLTGRPNKKTEEGKAHSKAISMRIPTQETEVTIEELAQLILKGHSWMPGVFDGYNRQEVVFKQQRLVVTEFDCGLAPETAKARLEEFGVPWKFFHTTFSDSPELRKFRIIFDIGYVETDINVVSTYLAFLAEMLFPESDQKGCKSVCNWFFGGKEVFYENYDSAPLDITALEQAATAYFMGLATSPSGATRANKKAKAISARSPKTDTSTGNTIELIRNVNIEELVERLSILDSFANQGFSRKVSCYAQGERLHYTHLFGIATNLQYIEGGPKWFNKILEQNGCYEPYHFAITSSIKGRNYKPSNLDGFSPFEEDWDYKNILQATGVNAHNAPRPVSNYKREAYRLEDVEVMLEKTFNQIIESDDTDVHILKVATGVGKTQFMIDLHNKSQGSQDFYVFAAPNHGLKDEILARMGVRTLDDILQDETLDSIGRMNAVRSMNLYVTAKQPSCLPSVVAKELEYYYKIGAYKKAMSRIRELKKELTNPMQLQALELSEKTTSQAYGQSSASVLTSHTKALTKNLQDGTFPFAHCKTMIFDECIIHQLLQSHTVYREDLHNLRAIVKTKGSSRLKEQAFPIIDHYLDVFNQAAFANPMRVVVMDSDLMNELIKIISGTKIGYFEGNPTDLFRLRGWYALDDKYPGRFHYTAKSELPKERKIIILSATADERVYRELIPADRLKFYDYSNVIPKGTLVQDATKSCSRVSLSNEKTRDYVVEQAGTRPTITFKDFKRYFQKPAEPHFYNCVGYDELRGQDINVVGTPYISPNKVFLMGLALGMDITGDHKQMVEQMVVRNGYRFKLRTFENEVLRDIQCSFIESEMIQAIGRARLMRYDCKVYLYSNYPIPSYKEDDVVVLTIDAPTIDAEAMTVD